MTITRGGLEYHFVDGIPTGSSNGASYWPWPSGLRWTVGALREKGWRIVSGDEFGFRRALEEADPVLFGHYFDPVLGKHFSISTRMEADSDLESTQHALWRVIRKKLAENYEVHDEWTEDVTSAKEVENKTHTSLIYLNDSQIEARTVKTPYGPTFYLT